MKNKRALFSIVGILLLVTIGVTFALYFTSSSYLNKYKVGNYNLVTSETFTSPNNWQPGEKIAKSVYATNDGDVPAAFRVKYTEKWEDSNGNDITATVPSDAVILNFVNVSQWEYNSSDGYYYYKYRVDPGKSSSSFISSIKLNDNLVGDVDCVNNGDTYNCTSNLTGLMGATYTITFLKETVQHTKYQTVWNTNVSIDGDTPEPIDGYKVGDEVCFGDECFEYLYSVGNNMALISKYNLNVGRNPKGGVETFRQDDEVYGYYRVNGVDDRVL